MNTCIFFCRILKLAQHLLFNHWSFWSSMLIFYIFTLADMSIWILVLSGLLITIGLPGKYFNNLICVRKLNIMHYSSCYCKGRKRNIFYYFFDDCGFTFWYLEKRIVSCWLSWPDQPRPPLHWYMSLVFVKNSFNNATLNGTDTTVNVLRIKSSLSILMIASK